MIPPVTTTQLPLPLVRRGKVRDVYDAGAGRLLMVASDRISAFDVVMPQPIPLKGYVLTQITVWWLQRLPAAAPHHLITADAGEIVQQLPALASSLELLAGRAMLVRLTRPLPVECVVRGYLSGSAWKEYRESGTLAGERLPAGLRQSDRLDPPIFSPATKAEEGHDENITYADVAAVLGAERAQSALTRSLALYNEGRTVAAGAGIIIADTKFEFGIDAHGTLVLIDEVLTPDSSRFWPAQQYQPGRAQPSFDKQPVRDYLEELTGAGRWNKQPPGPELPREVVEATTERYRAVYELLTGTPLQVPEAA